MNTETVITSFRTLFARRPELAQRLRSSADLSAAAEALARIGAENGIAANPVEIRSYVRSMVQRGTTGSMAGELNDASLDLVSAGRGDPGPALLLDLLLPGLPSSGAPA